MHGAELKNSVIVIYELLVVQWCTLRLCVNRGCFLYVEFAYIPSGVPDGGDKERNGVHVSSVIGSLLSTSPGGGSRDVVVSVPSWDGLAREFYSANRQSV